ncbi:hypothetical protein T440DRAFT_466368 [Plenodomus tracheiphilus IPT5]|uniref:Uncharacterized protein n=1 Tax=Plenodomus tracheiphilus IPT5 TaxID=1408161 RepID=A0A6A7BBZ8_9PLEO|nr:hypothetical protein T440DRAFT_466368 [Plenodomus tracheiphilus IPT5]
MSTHSTSKRGLPKPFASHSHGGWERRRVWLGGHTPLSCMVDVVELVYIHAPLAQKPQLCCVEMAWRLYGLGIRSCYEASCPSLDIPLDEAGNSETSINRQGKRIPCGLRVVRMRHPSSQHSPRPNDALANTPIAFLEPAPPAKGTHNMYSPYMQIAHRTR